MIKNIVFDFGNVLVRFSPDYITEPYAESEEDRRLISETAFDRLYWDRLDAGTITDEEVVRLACERLPARLHGACRDAYYNWVHRLPRIEGMWELVERLRRESGVRLFLLSNIGEYFVNFLSEYPVLENMEKCIFSAVIGKTKPNREIFEYLLRSSGIIAEETLFIDDSEKNIRGAESLNIKGYLFDGDSDRLSRYLDKILEKV